MNDLQKHWPRAKANGIEYCTYYARVQSGMAAHRAAEIPPDKVGPKKNPNCISQQCKTRRIGRGTFYNTRKEMMDKSGRLPTPEAVIALIEDRRSRGEKVSL